MFWLSNKDYFNFYVDMMKDGSLFPGYLTLWESTPRPTLRRGPLEWYIDGTWMPGSYATQMDAKCN